MFYSRGASGYAMSIGERIRSVLMQTRSSIIWKNIDPNCAGIWWCMKTLKRFGFRDEIETIMEWFSIERVLDPVGLFRPHNPLDECWIISTLSGRAQSGAGVPGVCRAAAKAKRCGGG